MKRSPSVVGVSAETAEDSAAVFGLTGGASGLAAAGVAAGSVGETGDFAPTLVHSGLPLLRSQEEPVRSAADNSIAPRIPGTRAAIAVKRVVGRLKLRIARFLA